MNLDELYNEASEFLQVVPMAQNLSQKEAVIYLRNNLDKNILNKYYIVCSLFVQCTGPLCGKVLLIKFSMDSMIKNQISHPDLKLFDYKKIENILKCYDEIFFDRKNNLRFFKNIDGKLYEIVVKNTKNGEENYLTTFHRCDESKIKKLKR